MDQETPDLLPDAVLEAPYAAPPKRTPVYYSQEQQFGAAFRRGNTLGSVAAMWARGGFDVRTADPNATAMVYDMVKGTKYESRLMDFVDDGTEADVWKTMARLDAEDRDREIVDQTPGALGVLYGLTADVLDPTNYLAVGGIIKTGKGGYSLLKSAASIGAMNAASVAAQEAVLQGTQLTRTADEGVINVASGALFGAILGGGAAKFMSNAERRLAEQLLDRDRAMISRHAGQDVPEPKPVEPGAAPSLRPAEPVPAGEVRAGEAMPEAPMPAGDGFAKAAGAAAADTRTLDLVSYGLNRIPGVRSVVEKMSPTLRVYSSGFVEGKRFLADLAESALTFAENAAGVPTSFSGPPVDRLARLHINQARYETESGIDDLWMRHRFGDPGTPEAAGFIRTTLAKVGSDIQALRGVVEEGKLTHQQFLDEIGRAMRRNDRHAIPEVAEAAKLVRAKVFEPWKKRITSSPQLREAFGWPEDIDPKTADSYFMRVWDREQIRARKPELAGRIEKWLTAEQTRKAQIKDNLSGLVERRDFYADKLADLDRKMALRERRLAETESRAAELQMLNRFAYRRSATMSEPLDELRAAIRTTEARIKPQLDALAEISAGIKAEKDNFPAIREADAAIFRLIGAGQKIAQGRDLVEGIDALEEFSTALNEAKGAIAAGVRAASNNAQAARLALGADVLVALEKQRAEINKTIRPAKKQLLKLRRDLKKQEAAKLPNARGGAPFETQIRNRGNTIADKVSGRKAELDDMEREFVRLAREHENVRASLEREIDGWGGDSTKDAKRALKRRAELEAERQAKMDAGEYKGKGGRMTSADAAVDAAVKRIMNSDRDLTPEDLRNRAYEIIDRIISSPNGRLPYETASTVKFGERVPTTDVRGPLAAREFMIPDELVEDFLDSNAERIAATYLHTMVPDVLVTERFGDVTATEAFRRINDEANRKIEAATSDTERARIGQERDRVIDDVGGVLQRVRGLYALPADELMRNVGRVSRAVRTYNILTDMGGVVLNSLSELSGPIFRFGFQKVFGEAWVPFFASLRNPEHGYRAAGRQYRAAGIAADIHLNTRLSTLGDVVEEFRPESRLERTLSAGANMMQLINLQAPWTDMGKTMASVVAGNEILRATKAVAAGTQTEKQLAMLAESNIDRATAATIWREFEKTGEIRDGIHLPNTADWRSRGAREAFEAAVAREADIAIVTPGQEKPFWLSRPIGALIGQYKTFTAGATERVLIANLQRSDARALSGLMAAVTGGMLSYAAYSLASNRPLSDNPADWVREGISRSGVLGWLEEANTFSSKFTGNRLDMYRLIGSDRPLSKYSSRSALGQMLGPTAGKIEGLIGGMSHALGGQWGAADSTALRRIVPFQNLIGLRLALDQVERGVNEALGVPAKPVR